MITKLKNEKKKYGPTEELKSKKIMMKIKWKLEKFGNTENTGNNDSESE